MQFLLVTLAIIGFGEAQIARRPRIEFLFNLLDKPGDGYPLTDELNRFPKFAKTAKRICVTGMWALYTQENFGDENPGITTVYPVSGAGGSDCTQSSVEDIIRSIKSVRPLGGVATNKNGFEIFEHPYFLGKKVPSPYGESVTATFHSAALYTVQNNYLICNSSDLYADKYKTCVCMDANDRQSYVIPDLTKFPPSSPINFGERIVEIDDEDCRAYPIKAVDLNLTPEANVIALKWHFNRGDNNNAKIIGRPRPYSLVKNLPGV